LLEKPEPVKGTVWVPVPALSMKVRVPVRDPDAVGVKVTLKTQEVPGTTLSQAEDVTEKSPLAATLVMVSACVPVLSSVTAWATLGVPTIICVAKVRLEGERETAAGATPAPLNATVCVPVPALSEMVRVPVRVPTAVGVKVALMVQLPAATTVVPQVLVWAKSKGFAPVIAMLEKMRLAFPVLLTVTD